MKIDKTKQYQSRDGFPVTIYTTEARGDFPVQGCIHNAARDFVMEWRQNGFALADSPADGDLIEILPDINDHVPVPSMWLTRDSINDWHLSFGDMPKFNAENQTWRHGIYEVRAINSRLLPAESLHKAVDGRWVRWHRELDHPLSP